jgi:hypothetical protein
MPEAAFLKLYNAALTRECATILQFFRNGKEFSPSEWAKRVDYADTLVTLGEEFIDGVNSVARDRGLIDDETPTPVCPRCGRESCPGASTLPFNMVKVMQINSDD